MCKIQDRGERRIQVLGYANVTFNSSLEIERILEKSKSKMIQKLIKMQIL